MILALLRNFNSGCGLSPCPQKIFALYVAAMVLLTGCGATSAPVTIAPFSDEDALAFEHGVDFIVEPGVSGGMAFERWRGDLNRRVARADRIDLVSVRAVHTGVDLDQMTTLRLALEVREPWFGSYPEREYSIEVSESEVGFRSVNGSEQRLLREQFVAFVRFQEEDGERLKHWHLSMVSEQLSSIAREGIDERASGRTVRRTVRHN